MTNDGKILIDGLTLGSILRTISVKLIYQINAEMALSRQSLEAYLTDFLRYEIKMDQNIFNTAFELT